MTEEHYDVTRSLEKGKLDSGKRGIGSVICSKPCALILLRLFDHVTVGESFCALNGTSFSLLLTSGTDYLVTADREDE